MRKIVVIARAELSNLFYSPIAWLLLIIFLVQCSLTFTDVIHTYQIIQSYAKLYPMTPRPATLVLMYKDQIATGLFLQMVDKLYLYLPLLTMGLISREVNSGTIRLLYSSPVKTGQIVLGKFLAMVIYNLLLLVVLGIFASVAAWGIPHVDTALLLSGLLGFFLLLGAYAAIGLFMSCLTAYQVVAALSTLAVFAALRYIGTVWQGVDFVRDLTWFLSLGNRTESMFKGMITSRDVLYFIIVIVLFLSFSLFRLQADQEFRPVGVRIARYGGLLALAIGIGYFTSRPSLVAYWDITAPKTNTITPVTQALLQSTGEEPLEITAYVNLLDNNYRLCAPEARQSYLAFWERYVQFKNSIRFNYVYYYDTSASIGYSMKHSFKGKTLREVAEDYARVWHVNLNRFIAPEAARKVPGLHGEDGRFVMQLRYKGRTTFLRVFNDQQVWPSEDQICGTMKRLIRPDEVPKVGFLEGGLERGPFQEGDRGYEGMTTDKGSRGSLINNGFDVVTVEEGQEIPSGLTTLVVADPKVALSTETMGRLKAYIAGGGNLLVTSEPGKQEMLNPLLQPLGVRLREGVLVQPEVEEVSDLVMGMLTRDAGDMSKGAASLLNGSNPVFLPGALALDYRNKPADSAGAFTTRPLLVLNGEHSWLKKGHLVDDSAAVEFNTADGDEHGNFVPAVALTRLVNGRQQRIAVVGDGDFMSNASLELQKRRSGFTFGSALFKWFSGNAFPVELSRLQPKDTRLAITDDQLSHLNLLFVWLLPGLLAVAATVLLIRRKRK